MSFLNDDEEYDEKELDGARRLAFEYDNHKLMCDKHWTDPNPNYKINYINISNDVIVIRDDTICGGTKARFLADSLPLSTGYDEFVYVSSHYGGAQVALAVAVRQLNTTRGSKYKATVFTTPIYSNEKYPAYVRLAKELGANIIESDDPHDDAYEYCEQQSEKRYLLPNGLALPKLEDHLINLAKRIKSKFGQFDLVCSVIGSGTLTRCLQKAGLGKRYLAIGTQGGNYNHTILFQFVFYFPNILSRNKGPAHAYNGGDAEIIVHDQEFKDLVRKNDIPPFPSSGWYDAKGWKYLWDIKKADDRREKGHNKRMYLFWNVY